MSKNAAAIFDSGRNPPRAKREKRHRRSVDLRDKQVDALDIRIQEKVVARTQEISEGVNVDRRERAADRFGVLGATEHYSLADILNLSTENRVLEKRQSE